MESSAPKKENNSLQVLITDAGSYLGSELASSLLLSNCSVFAIGNPKNLENLISKPNFTLLELDLAQPLPSHLPKFDLIFYLDFLKEKTAPLPNHHLPPPLVNIVNYAKKNNVKTFICAPIREDTRFFQSVSGDSHLFNLTLLGDLYGPRINLHEENKNALIPLLRQAIETDKIILENEGLNLIYPTYISDFIFAINKLAFSHHGKNISSIVSESPKNALTVAYEIQNAANLEAKKTLGLFFSGPQGVIPPQEAEAKVHLDFHPKITLSEGLKETFGYFLKEKLIKSSSGNPVHHHPLTSNLPQVAVHQAQINTSPIKQEIPPQKNYKNFASGLHSKLPDRLKGKRGLIFLIVFLLVGSILKTGFDIYWGAKNLSSSKESLYAGDFKKASQNANSAEKSFRAAANKTEILLLPASFIAKTQTESITDTLAAASLGADSFSYFIDGAKVLFEDLQTIASGSKESKLDLDSPSADFEKAFLLASQAQKLASKNTPKILGSKVQKLQDNLDNLSSFSSSMKDFSIATDNLIGKGSPKTYLVLLQNNTELRPGGGFIGNFGLIEFDGSHLKNISVEDVYVIDGQLKEKIEPPAKLKEKLGVEQFFLRDSNWTPDFSLNAQTARDFYKKETGKNVDGVIALDLTVVQNFLSKTGAVKLEDYKEEITAENLFEKGEYYSEIGFFPGSTQKRDFFGALLRKIISKITTEKDKAIWPALAKVIQEGLAKKDVMVAFDDPELSSFVSAHGWDNPVPQRSYNLQDELSSTKDFLALSEANLGANKVNRLIDRKISYEMTIGRDADLVAKLTINYTNKSQAETWPAGKYVNYLRVYVPAGSDLFAFSSGQDTGPEKVEVTTQGPLTTFATDIEVPIKSTREISFTYRIKKNLNLEKAPVYSLYIQKQPGTGEDPLEFILNLPSYLAEKASGNQNLKFSTNLSADREFKIEVAKK